MNNENTLFSNQFHFPFLLSIENIFDISPVNTTMLCNLRHGFKLCANKEVTGNTVAVLVTKFETLILRFSSFREYQLSTTVTKINQE